jgi:hypothetical protein
LCRRGPWNCTPGTACGHAFAPQGAHSIYDLIANGIALAKEFVFIENLIAARPIHAAPVSKLLAAKNEGPKLQNPVRGASGLERELQLAA